jgi:LmbE family N-acetylglucosaminyl deacetylase
MRQIYQALMQRQKTNFSAKDLEKSAIIFSPHQDDETLGCGGTIIRKKQAGAEVKIVFMTDGAGSHSHIIPRQQLAEIRAKEAVAAAQKLGVEPEDILFLGIPDGSLTKNQAVATQKVIELLSRFYPEEVFIPYSQDGVPDHNATYQTVIDALKQWGWEATIYEYPIWFWNHWPWTVGAKPNNQEFSNFKQELQAGLTLIKTFQYTVYIGDILEQKRAALNQHQSQVTQLIPHPRWLTLGDVSQGEFLNCFFQDYERFHRYQFTQNSVC